jgi:hypothetical protein
MWGAAKGAGILECVRKDFQNGPKVRPIMRALQEWHGLIAETRMARHHLSPYPRQYASHLETEMPVNKGSVGLIPTIPL